MSEIDPKYLTMMTQTGLPLDPAYFLELEIAERATLLDPDSQVQHANMKYDVWPYFVGPDGRLHPQYHILATGRIQNSKPATGNLPKSMRKAIRSKDAWIVELDFSGCHWRLIAKESGDPELLNDILVHGDPYYRLTQRYGDRKLAKTVLNTLANGGGETSLAKSGITKPEEVIDFLETEYPIAMAWIHNVIKTKDPIPGKPSHTAVANYLQGAEALALKLVISKFYERVSAKFDNFRLILPLHDSLIFQAKADEPEIRKFAGIMSIVMAKALFGDHAVATTSVTTKVGRSWGDLVPLSDVDWSIPGEGEAISVPTRIDRALAAARSGDVETKSDLILACVHKPEAVQTLIAELKAAKSKAAPILAAILRESKGISTKIQEFRAKIEGTDLNHAGDDIPGLQRTPDGNLKRSSHNLSRIVAEDRGIGLTRWDVWQQTVQQIRDNDWKDITDVEATRIKNHLSKTYGLEYSDQEILSQLRLAADDSHFDEIQEYLAGLKWDGEARLDTFFCTYAGAEDTDLHRAYSRCLFLGMVTRAQRPGCKHDLTVILHGSQGARKSSLFAALVPDPKFFSDKVDMESKDGEMNIRGKWLIEMAELTAIRKSEVEATKSFLTRQVDEYRAPYASLPEKHPRRCVFVGSTNDDDPLVDVTGNRRFGIIPIGRRIDVEGALSVRDQVLAEAVVRLAAGETHWLTEDEERLQQEANTKWRHVSPVETEALTWAAQQVGGFTTLDIATAIGIKINALPRNFSRILENAGYRQKRDRSGGRLWVRADGSSISVEPREITIDDILDGNIH